MSLDDQQCDTELDDIVPAMSGKTHVVVTSGGVGAGKYQAKSTTGTTHLVIAVRVVVFLRIGDVPQDRRRDIYLQNVTGLNALLGDVMTYVDGIEAIKAEAEALLTGSAATGKFHKVPRFVAADPKAVTVHREAYNSAGGTGHGHEVLAMKRGLVFGGAEFMLKA
jgi:hypothetical protein